MTEDAKAIDMFIKLVRSSCLNPCTNNMLEYLLYQLNLAMLTGRRSSTQSADFPCSSAEIEELNRLIIAAGNGSAGCATAAQELIDRVSLIVDRIHFMDQRLEARRKTDCNPNLPKRSM